MHLDRKICYLIILTVTFSARAAVLFEDDFGNRDYSRKNWTLISTDPNGLQFIDNKAKIINNDETYSALAVHSFTQDLSSFTISAKISSEYPGSGLYFCFDDLRDGYRGYAALLSDDGIYIYKFYPESVSVVTRQTSAFVKLEENRLAISKNNEKINVFCNGYFIFSVTDGEFSSGDIALIVPPGSEAFFDDVITESCIADTSHFETFTDDFLKKDLFGWTSYGNALTDWSNSNLKIQTGNYQEFYNSLEIPLNSFSMKTVVLYNQGDSSSFYGFFIKVKDSSDTASFFYQFAISADKKFVIRRKNLMNEPVNYQFATVNVTAGYDTLELIGDNNNFTFLANGKKLGEFCKANGSIAGAGLFISSLLNVSFDKFQIMNLGMQTSTQIIKKRDYKTQFFVKECQPIDLLGRSISRNMIYSEINLVLESTGAQKWQKRIKMRK
ncbi:MAG TPA: hypothetical protein VHP36_04150 [Chitinispirillaceae bacterium]|nr:hypothetical protein [Chitinispirillaceae bacterium]